MVRNLFDALKSSKKLLCTENCMIVITLLTRKFQRQRLWHREKLCVRLDHDLCMSFPLQFAKQTQGQTIYSQNRWHFNNSTICIIETDQLFIYSGKKWFGPLDAVSKEKKTRTLLYCNRSFRFMPVSKYVIRALFRLILGEGFFFVCFLLKRILWYRGTY